MSWNKGLKVSGMSGHSQSEFQKSIMRMMNLENNPSKRPEVKEKMRLAKLGKVGGNLGKHWKINPAKLVNFGKVRGENHWNWIADRSLLKKKEQRNDSAYQGWRQQVWLRDNFACKIANPDCDGHIEAHHILGWSDHPELRYEINNGITLCHAHHPRKRAEEKRLSPYFQGLVSVSKTLI